MTVPENPIGGWNATLNGFQSIRYVNGHVDILYSYDVSFAVQYISTCTFIQRRDQTIQFMIDLLSGNLIYIYIYMGHSTMLGARFVTVQLLHP